MVKKTISLKKEVFDKSRYVKTIDTSFNELGVKTVTQQLDEETTVEEFFDLYSELFYTIPAEGNTNSHRFLVEQSGEYINFDENLEEIEALREEIARLRTDILSLQIKNMELETGQKINVNTDALKDQINSLGSDITSNANAVAEAQAQTEQAIVDSNKEDPGVDTSGVGYFSGGSGRSGGY
jgi:hypothetical protein